MVRRLLAAGAVVIGKTACPELCMWPFTQTVTFGHTRNPWNTTRAPGGSSCGGGAATAAGLTCLALGSDAKLDPHTRQLVRCFRHQTTARPRSVGALPQRLLRPEFQRAADPDSRGCCAVLGRNNVTAWTRRRIRCGIQANASTADPNHDSSTGPSPAIAGRAHVDSE